MTDQPDFEALRAKRNAETAERLEKLRAEGWTVSGCAHNNPDACYCACPEGPCEHRWDGEPYESADRTIWSTTCSRCGMASYSHSLRVGP